MATTYVTQQRIERVARDLARSAMEMFDVASPWIEPYPAQKLLRELLPQVGPGEIAVGRP